MTYCPRLAVGPPGTEAAVGGRDCREGRERAEAPLSL